MASLEPNGSTTTRPEHPNAEEAEENDKIILSKEVSLLTEFRIPELPFIWNHKVPRVINFTLPIFVAVNQG